VSQGCNNGEVVCQDGKTFNCSNAHNDEIACNTCGGEWTTYTQAAYSTPIYAHQPETYKTVYNLSNYKPATYTPNTYKANTYTPNTYTPASYAIAGYTPVYAVRYHASYITCKMGGHVCISEHNGSTTCCGCSSLCGYLAVVNHAAYTSYYVAYYTSSYKVASYKVGSYTPASYAPNSYAPNTYAPVYAESSAIQTYAHDYVSTYTHHDAVYSTSCPNATTDSVCLGYKYTQQWDCWKDEDGAPYDDDCNASGVASSTSCNLSFKTTNALEDCNLDGRGTSCAAWTIVNGNMIYLDSKEVYW
ncbi:hypothetical protein IJV79_04295, partial [bacterium]|nr:hypothetical protein [bacterium]